MLFLRRAAALLLVPSTLVAIAASSCGGDAERDPNAGAGGSGPGSSATSNAGGCSSECPTTSTGAGGGSSCGGFAGGDCAADEFCDFPDDSCGAFDTVGTCTPRPEGCNLLYDPRCGCDGKVYENACDASWTGGTDVNNAGGCSMPPTGTFGCGPTFCLKGQQYCRQANDDTGMPPSFMCVQLPPQCTGMNLSCMCLANEPCASDECEVDANGDVKITCFGG